MSLADRLVLRNRGPRALALSALVSLAPSLAAAQQASSPPLELDPIFVSPLEQIVVTAPLVIQSAAPERDARAAGAPTANPPSGAPTERPAPPLLEPRTPQRQPTQSTRETASHDETRCASGQRSYFDDRAQIYRPCPGPGEAPIARAVPRVRRARATREADLCASGVRSYFDEANQIYRPCPERTPPRPSRGQASSSSTVGGRRCALGQRSYYDEDAQLYRPCP